MKLKVLKAILATGSRILVWALYGRGNTLAIGCVSGRVVVVRFKPDASPILGAENRENSNNRAN
jgi:hypothetical protein